ncbi:MAG: T9SS type A sorting domain-containing protein [candidate division KSB1 bacterium]|nr:T9SS type A sorting domain-containing protein [candidate division KSB1 bacterium]MDZ7303188.1 T9SS type A sorting domain-containing protein [candidate division KSB1 bacterium]MDZ7312200.1 T9SS type A sorting domain-containing protein [candidate division KSB1 bacterium]
MKRFMTILLIITGILAGSLLAQTNQWKTVYVTVDDRDNGTGHNTPSVAVLGDNYFVALVNTPTSVLDSLSLRNYLVGYRDADSTKGRLGLFGYGSTEMSGKRSNWKSGSDFVFMDGAWQIANDNQNRVYIANNDFLHNILVFEVKQDSVYSTVYRMETGPELIWAIEVDANGYVYVVDEEATTLKNDELKVFAPIGNPAADWGGSHNSLPVKVADLPDGKYRGVTANANGTAVFVANATQRRIYKLVGSPSAGYAVDTKFNFVLSPSDIISGTKTRPTVLGLAYMETPGILIAAADSLRGGSTAYSYGRLYLINPANGAPVDTIDVAEWNFIRTGAYNDRPDGGRYGTASGYTSTYDVDVWGTTIYSQSHYGWTVEKWVFDGDLGRLVDVKERPADTFPQRFILTQNYPNPFNPTTTIDFGLPTNSRVVLKVLDINGRELTTLLNRDMSAGASRVSFDANHLPSGVYIYQLTAGGQKLSRRMTLLK